MGDSRWVSSFVHYIVVKYVLGRCNVRKRRAVGICLVSLPFVALALMPLYTPIPWWVMGGAFATALAVIGLVMCGVRLAFR